MKIVIIGSGNGGVWTALHYAYNTRNNKNIEVELIHDPEIDSFPVGQALYPGQSRLLYSACDIDWYHNEVRATPKLGILYENWSKRTPNLFHEFPFHQIAMQADPKYLQKYILNSGLFAVKEGNVTDLDMVDADVIFDCRGNIDKDNIEYESLYCPVNSVLLAVGPSPNVLQLWSRHVATPDGWTFVIPNTTDTTSYGYLYNKDITPLETAKTNFSELFPEASESYSGHFDHKQEVVNLPFKSYMAKTPIRVDSNGRKIILNGNRLTFLEPMESTAIGLYVTVARYVYNWVLDETGDLLLNKPNSKINKIIHESHKFISWHYTRGSIYDTPFWRDAQTKTNFIFDQSSKDFHEIVDFVQSVDYIDLKVEPLSVGRYGLWPTTSIKRWYDGHIK